MSTLIAPKELLKRLLRPLIQHAVSLVSTRRRHEWQSFWQGDDNARIITTFDELDAELQKIDEGFAISDDEARRRMASFRFAYDGDFPADPYSPEYAAAQMRMYYILSGRSSYDPHEEEQTEFDIEEVKRSFFPYYTGSANTVGDQLIAWGFLIRAVNLPAGSSILEFGPGWGNTTIQLAQMGYQLTAVEIEQRFVDLINFRAQRLGLDVATIRADMASFSAEQRFDAVLFFECFHHCADHLAMLRRLDDLVSPGGQAVFAAEPIADFPHPWGFVRDDGMTLWSIRRFGWFEQGFDTSYFLRTLLFLGWLPTRYVNDISPLANVIVARRSEGIYDLATFTLPPDEASTWSPPINGTRHATRSSMLSCAREPIPAEVHVCMSNRGAAAIGVTVRAGTASTTTQLAAGAEESVTTLPPAEWAGEIRVESDEISLHDQLLGAAVHWIRLTYAEPEAL